MDPVYDGPRLAVDLYCATPAALCWLDAIAYDASIDNDISEREKRLDYLRTERLKRRRRARSPKTEEDRDLDRSLGLLRNTPPPISHMTFRYATVTTDEPAASLVPILFRDHKCEEVRKTYERIWDEVLDGWAVPDHIYGMEIFETTYELLEPDDNIYLGKLEKWLLKAPISPIRRKAIHAWAIDRPRGDTFSAELFLEWLDAKPEFLRDDDPWFAKIPNPGQFTLEASDVELIRKFRDADDSWEIAEPAIRYVESMHFAFCASVAPRIWRILAEWAYVADNASYMDGRQFLPLPYREFGYDGRALG